MKIAVLGTSSKGGVQGGAENLYKGLVNALKDHNVNAELICPISDETNFETIKESYLRFYDLDLSTFDGVISTKVPAYLVRHPNHICYLMHTIRVFYDMFEKELKSQSKEFAEQREFIQLLDTLALQFPRIKKIFVIGNEVKNRLSKYNNLESTVLYPGLLNNNFKEGSFDYVFMPGRLHRWKRVNLIIKAMRFVQAPVRLLISGEGEDGKQFREIAKGDPRIEFLGRVMDHELISLYSNSLCVPFVPIHEDYGYVTIEAFRSGKPVITCIDSGEPSRIVKNNISGFICNPDPKEIAEKIDFFYSHPEAAKNMGSRGKLSTLHITWDATVEKLLASLLN